MSDQGYNPSPRSIWADGAGRARIFSLKTFDNLVAKGVGRPPLFSGISAAEYTAISAAARAKEFARGEVIYIEGDPVEQVVLLSSGSMKTTRLGLSGSEVILRVWVPGDLLGPVDLFGSGRHSTTAQAFRFTRALVWDISSFKALVDRFPVLNHNMLRISVRYLADLEERFRELATERVGPRVARQLVRLLSQIGQAINGTVEVDLSREELAQMTGTTLFTVSRLLSAWAAHGWVRPRRAGVTICDIPALSAIAEDLSKDAELDQRRARGSPLHPSNRYANIKGQPGIRHGGPK